MNKSFAFVAPQGLYGYPGQFGGHGDVVYPGKIDPTTDQVVARDNPGPGNGSLAADDHDIWIPHSTAKRSGGYPCHNT